MRPPVPSSATWAKNRGENALPKPTLKPVRGSKTLAARTLKQRASVQDAFTKPQPKPNDFVMKKSGTGPSLRSPTCSTESSDAFPAFSPKSKRSSRTSSDSGELLSGMAQSSSSMKLPSSSTTLRETIAKAKAARQKAKGPHNSSVPTRGDRLDPFTNVEMGNDNGGLLRKRVATARTDGRLNIAALGLREIPPEVMNMYNANLGDGAWYESVDLVRLIAADNEFEQLSDTCLPDETIETHQDQDDYQGNLFAGLETLDLHGNHLSTIPVGLRRLNHLTTLNLSKNGLGDDSLAIIGQIESLKELRMAENRIETIYDLFKLHELEILDLHNNRITILPSNIQRLSNLHILNISGNKLESLSFECLKNLVELNASRNKLSGSLLRTAIDLPNLKMVDVANNALTSLMANGTARLSSLQSLNITENRLLELPDVSDWTELLTLAASGNKLSAFPEGFTRLPRIKNVDFARNDIRRVDDQIGFMDSLTVLRVANNPLGERRYLTMDTEELKRDLKARSLPEKSGQGTEKHQEEADLMLDRDEIKPRTWPIKPGGILDRSSTKLTNIEASDLDPLVTSNDIKALNLPHNLLSCIPQVIGLMAHSLTTLDVSDNKLAGANYLSEELSLPNLRSLNLSSNSINTLQPLMDKLLAPSLADLNVSRNRLVSLLPFRNVFPSLTSLNAADNSICVLGVEDVRGLHVVNVSGNEIDHLEPKLGLLAGEGLRTLVVGGNRFRVPRRDVIDKGTDAVLTWLRSRIPEGE